MNTEKPDLEYVYNVHFHPERVFTPERAVRELERFVAGIPHPSPDVRRPKRPVIDR